MKAIRNGTVEAGSDDAVVVEGDHYFPMTAVRRKLLRPSARATTCARASHHTLDVDVAVRS